jgi:hypothetical protein
MFQYTLYADNAQEAVAALKVHFTSMSEQSSKKLATMVNNPARYRKRDIEAARIEQQTLELAVLGVLERVVCKPTSEQPVASPLEKKEVAS